MTKNRKIVIMVFVLMFLGWLFWGNVAIEVNRYMVSSKKIASSFDGFVIAHISDVHNTKSKYQQEQLFSLINESSPNIIAITGDLIDSRNTDVDVALSIVEDLMKIAPCYYVSGNHEARVEEYKTLKEGLVDLGVTILEDEIVYLDASFSIIGVKDSSFSTSYLFGDDKQIMNTALASLIDKRTFTVLLSHRPELYDVYNDYNIDVVFSGHAHGGQFRLPFIGGVIAPNQGLFPKYDSGLYAEGDTTMFVSRGIGNSIIPMRVNNLPEVIIVTLESE